MNYLEGEIILNYEQQRMLILWIMLLLLITVTQKFKEL